MSSLLDFQPYNIRSSMPVCVFCNGRGKAPRDILVPCSANYGSRCKSCQDLIDIDERIAVVAETLLGLRQERYRLLSEVNRTHDTIINRFPPEIFAECLRHSLPSIQDYYSTSPGSVIPKGPSVLAASCKSWRDLVCEIPNLWTVIPILVSNSQDPRPMAYALNNWLPRSGVLPLSITIDVTSSGRRYWNQFQNTIQEIMGLINNQSHRLVFFRATGIYTWLKFLDFETLRARNLRHLEIVAPENANPYPYSSMSLADYAENYTASPDEHNDPGRIIRFGPATEPTTLCVDSNYRWKISQLDIGTNHLTHIVAAYWTVGDILNVLQRSPQLISCSISNCNWIENTVLANTAVYHSSLRALDISTSLSATNNILRSVQLPCLQSFHIYQFWDIEVMEQFLEFLYRSTPPLEVLHFDDVYIRQPGVQNVIAAIMAIVGPSLRSFFFRSSLHLWPLHVIRSQELVDAIFGTGASLPLLQSVALYGMEYCWSHTLLSLVGRLSRSQQPPPKIILYVLSHNSEETVEGLVTSSGFNQSNAYPVEEGLSDRDNHDELPVISSAEISEMMTLIDQYALSFAVHMDTEISRMREPVDIFPEIRTRLLDISNTISDM
ncbi:hypothetical protein D9619_002397 [Psilocybe cf. subviscida]|uniref:F-box domain-containing protein n=1 Tax=Psilocybe cf. subviscida TaxID=2480587 RepID=A0A8H5AW66_9AGAR|nr:hypothetical protein D9619_002397 [Psilocybe cf. subviscida]